VHFTGLAPGLQTSVSLWQLNLASELLFIGDAGTTEAGRPSRRTGIEIANYYTPAPGWIIDADFAWFRSGVVMMKSSTRLKRASKIAATSAANADRALRRQWPEPTCRASNATSAVPGARPSRTPGRANRVAAFLSA